MQKTNNFKGLTDRMYNTAREYGRADLVRIGKVVELCGSGKKILDVGCYYGFLGNLLLKKQNEVYGIDIAKKALLHAEKLGLKTKFADVEKRIPYQNKFFDLVVAAEVIEHIKDTASFLEEIHRVLKPGGTLVMSTPNLVSFGRRIAYLLGKNGYHEASFNYPADAAGHLRYFNKELLIGFLSQHNFETLEYTSDIVNLNFNTKSKMQSILLAQIFPTLGRSLIVKAIKTNKKSKNE